MIPKIVIRMSQLRIMKLRSVERKGYNPLKIVERS